MQKINKINIKHLYWKCIEERRGGIEEARSSDSISAYSQGRGCNSSCAVCAMHPSQSWETAFRWIYTWMKQVLNHVCFYQQTWSSKPGEPRQMAYWGTEPSSVLNLCEMCKLSQVTNARAYSSPTPVQAAGFSACMCFNFLGCAHTTNIILN